MTSLLRFLATSVLTVCALRFSVATAQQPSVSIPVEAVVANSYHEHGVNVLTSTHPDFRRALQGALNAATLTEIAPLLPYLVLIRNESTRDISATTVIFRRYNSAGASVDYTTQFATAKATGGLIIHCPQSDLSMSLQAIREGNGALYPLNTRATEIARSIFNPRRFSRVEIIVDSIAFADTSVIGPDSFGVVAEARARRQAQQAVINRILNTAISDEELEEWLADAAAQRQGYAPGRDGPVDHHRLALSSFAATMLEYLHQRGRPALQASMTDYAKRLASASSVSEEIRKAGMQIAKKH